MNMPILTQFQSSIQTMSSREIAQLCNKEHRNVCRDIESLNLTFEKLGLLKIEQGYFTHPSTGNQQHRQFLLTKDQCVDLVTGYNAELRIKINRRWAELENAQSKLPQSFSEALQLAADQARQLELQAPKVAFVDKYVAGNGNKTFRQVAKLLQIKENAFRDFLECNKIMYRLNGEWAVYSNHTDAKRFYIKTGVSESGHAFNHALFTPKGVEWIAGELAKSQVRGAA